MSQYKKNQPKSAQPAQKAKPAVTPSPVTSVAAPPSTVVTLEPLAPIVVRSGRPDAARADPARFPPPSTLAGCLRTAWARAQSPMPDWTALQTELLQQAVAGPLLVRMDDADQPTVLLPKPADALYFGQGDQARCVRAAPRPLEPGCGCDLPDGLLPVQLLTPMSEKSGKGPSWWVLADYLKFRQGQAINLAELKKNGCERLPSERRTHVALDSDRRAAQDGKLFETEGLDLAAAGSQPAMRLLARFDKPLAAGVVTLGGERRLAAVHPAAATLWPQAPAGWFEAIVEARGLSLSLLTPGLLAQGYRPGWLNAQGVGMPPQAPGVLLRLRAVVVERWQPQSGWDLVAWAPRQTRKLAPAGAVYWFELLNKPTVAALQALWFTSICDVAQDRRDGFGLVLPAAWSPISSQS